MNGEYSEASRADMDLGGVFASLWRNKLRLLLVAIITTLLAFVVLQTVEPRFRSEARILIRASDPVLTTAGDDTAVRQSGLDDPGIASQVQLLQSRSIAMKVVAELNLTDRPEFDPEANPSLLRTILSIVGLAQSGSGVTAQDRVLETYFERLKVFQADRARVVVVQFWSHDPKLAAQIPNLITREYLALQEELKRGAAPDALEKLEPELRALRQSVVQAEAAVAEFRESSDLLQGSNNETLATQELSELSTELGRVRAQLSRAEANADAVRRSLETGSLDAASSVLNSRLIQRLRERQASLNAQLADLSATLLPGHPRVKRLRSQVVTLTRQIADEAERIEASLQEEADTARAREQDLLQRRNQLKSEAGRVGRAQVQLRSLEREADAQRQLLNAYLLRFKEAKSRQERQFVPADAFVFSQAQEQSKAYFPKRGPILAATFFGTLLLGAMVVLAASVMAAPAASVGARPLREGTNEPEVDRKNEAAPSLAPRMDALTNSEVAPDLTAVSVAARSISMLGRARIAVLSPEGPKGSAGTVVLARYLASHGASVIVLDMTGQGASSKLMLGSDDKTGIKELMVGSARFAQAIHSDRASRAHVMPAGGPKIVLPAGSGQRLPAIVDALHKTYDFLIIDCGAAEISGLKRISNAETVNIINAVSANDPSIKMTGEMLVQAGYKEPLTVHARPEELQKAGLEVA